MKLRRRDMAEEAFWRQLCSVRPGAMDGAVACNLPLLACRIVSEPRDSHAPERLLEIVATQSRASDAVAFGGCRNEWCRVERVRKWNRFSHATMMHRRCIDAQKLSTGAASICAECSLMVT